MFVCVVMHFRRKCWLSTFSLRAEVFLFLNVLHLFFSAWHSRYKRKMQCTENEYIFAIAGSNYPLTTGWSRLQYCVCFIFKFSIFFLLLFSFHRFHHRLSEWFSVCQCNWSDGKVDWYATVKPCCKFPTYMHIPKYYIKQITFLFVLGNFFPMSIWFW